MHTMKQLVVDIETYTDMEVVNLLPDVKVDSRLTDDVKKQIDIANKRQEQIDKMALSPLYGKIACIGLYNEDIQQVLIGNEDDILKEFFKLTENTRLITYNGISFDIPFIYKRACKYGIKTIKEMKNYTSKYDNFKHCDLMVEFCNYNEYEKLDTLSKIYLNKSKIDFDVKTIKDLILTDEGKKDLSNYCMKDCELTYKLALKFGYIDEKIQI